MIPRSSTRRAGDVAICSRAASRRPRSASRTPWQRSATASTAGDARGLSGACVPRRDSARSPVAPGWDPTTPPGCAAEHRVDPSPVAGAARGGEPQIERGLAGAHVSEARQRRARTPWALASPAASGSAASVAAAAATVSAVSRRACGLVKTARWPTKHACHARRRGDASAKRELVDRARRPHGRRPPRVVPRTSRVRSRRGRGRRPRGTRGRGPSSFAARGGPSRASARRPAAREPLRRALAEPRVRRRRAGRDRTGTGTPARGAARSSRRARSPQPCAWRSRPAAARGAPRASLRAGAGRPHRG